MANDEQFEAWWDGLTMLDKTTASKGLARAAWNARLPEEHLAVVLEGLLVLEHDLTPELAARYAATRRFLEGHDD